MATEARLRASHAELLAALKEATGTLKDVAKDINYGLDSDYTPHEDRLISRLERVIANAKRVT